MRCPICGADIKPKNYKDEYWGFYIDSESDHSCSNCDYTDTWAYGYSEVSFCGKIWQWAHYTESKVVEEIEKEIEAAIEIHKGHPQFPHRRFRYYELEEELDVPF